MSNVKSIATTVIISPEQKILILQRGKATSGSGLWNFPGGGIESGESAQEAAIREVKEEANLTLDPARVDFLGVLHTRGLNINVFITKQFHGEVQLNKESDDYAWVSLEELQDYDFVGDGKIHEGISKSIEKFIQKGS